MGILALILLIAALGCFGYFIYKVIKIVKNHEIGKEVFKVEGKDKQLLLILVSSFGALLCLAAVFATIHFSMALKFWEYLLVIFGTIIMSVALATGLGAFILYYYKLDLDEKQKKFAKYAWPIGFLAFFVGLYLYTTGIAPYIYYPLVSGIDFSEGFIRGGETTGGFKLKFYGVLIVSGALLCYAITEHMCYKKYKQHGLIDTLFIVAFLFGILGARLWYCIVLEPDYYFSNPGQIIFGIADGGLAIQGGAILGIGTGVAFVLLFRKQMDVRYVMDVAIPTILLAQVAGRWGNFFNQEVFGNVTSVSSLWYLPKIVKYNMFIDGAYRVPLFFIEGTMNLAGYFIIRYFLGKVCKFHIGLGYQAGSYLVWYGLVRVILEPLREGYTASTSTSGFGYLQSYITAFAMIAGGILLIVGFYVLHRMRMKNGKEDRFGDKI